VKVVVKVGTHAIIESDGTVHKGALTALTKQVAELQQAGHQVVLVSSGAVSTGRRVSHELLGPDYGRTTVEKQVLSSLGQPELIQEYRHLFKKHNLLTAQLLLTKHDFQTRSHYLNIIKILKNILEHKNIIPVVNENDSVSIEELIFTDNDELAGLIAAQLGAEKLIIFTTVDGVFDKHPDEPDAQLISIINPDDESNWPSVSKTTSTHGRGGMISKLGVARKISGLGISTHIININVDDAIPKIMAGDKVGTSILAQTKKSNIKRWMAFSDWQKNGSIEVNQCLFDILKEGKRSISLLPVGIEECTGNFQKGDLIEVISPGKQQIGIGIARYDSNTLKEHIGKKGKPEIIHYDHLLIKIGT